LQKKWARAEARSLVSVSGTAAAPDELENRMDALHKSDVFGGVSEEDIEFFASMFDRRDLADGEVLCAKGDVATEIYVVKDGVVEVRVKSHGPPLATLGRSTVLGEYGMFTGERRNATVTAKGPVAVLTLDYERFRRFMIAFPEGTIALLKSAVLRQMKMREDI
jgi:CRP-like cAMP-binding protein